MILYAFIGMRPLTRSGSVQGEGLSGTACAVMIEYIDTMGRFNKTFNFLNYVDFFTLFPLNWLIRETYSSTSFFTTHISWFDKHFSSLLNHLTAVIG